jgi:hypothetical protein
MEDLVEKAGIPEKVTLLDALDVVIWMRYRSRHAGPAVAA